MHFSLSFFRFESRLQSKNLSKRVEIEKEKQTSPNNCPPLERHWLGDRRRDHPIPIGKFQNENKKQKEKNESPDHMLSPQVTETNKKEREKPAYEMVLFLKLVYLK